MSVLDGMRAFYDPQNGDSSLVEKAYQRFALTQPDGVEIQWFQGYKVSFILPVEEARRRFLEDEEAMFCRFSGHELPIGEKMRILARAMWKIERQDAAVKRPESLPLIALKWSEDEEKREIEADQHLWQEILKADPGLADTIAEWFERGEGDR